MWFEKMKNPWECQEKCVGTSSNLSFKIENVSILSGFADNRF